MKKWEYMVQRVPYDQPDLEKKLNILGQDGWEMSGCGRTGTDFDTSEILLIFLKREISESLPDSDLCPYCKEYALLKSPEGTFCANCQKNF